jgi:hypothetical protein
MLPSQKCPVCGTDFEPSQDGGRRKIDCKRCGSFFISDSINGESWTTSERAKLSGWLRDQFSLGDIPSLKSYHLPDILARPEKPVAERIERLLAWAVKKQQDLGGSVRLTDPSGIAATYSTRPEDVWALSRYLIEERLLSSPNDASLCQVTPRGFMKVGETVGGPSASAFIAMWFDPIMNSARQHLEAAVQSAGYRPIIVNNVEHVNKIDDEIVSQIRKARFLVADFTGHRGGVYFEAGLAMGLGMHVFWTCKKESMKDLHFDIRQYNCIDWASEEDLSSRLTKRIEAVLGQGPILPP